MNPSPNDATSHHLPGWRRTGAQSPPAQADLSAALDALGVFGACGPCGACGACHVLDMGSMSR